MSDPLIEGSVRNVRQLRAGWQAEVIVGSSNDHRTATLQVTCKSPEVMRAARKLQRAIQVEAAGVLEEAGENGAKWARAVKA